jgi:Cellulase (glycosyl hydrolase family 5)
MVVDMRRVVLMLFAAVLLIASVPVTASVRGRSRPAPASTSTAVAASTAPAAPGVAVTQELVVDGNLLRVDGRRWIARGVNLYVLPAGWPEATNATYRHRAAIFDRMVALGINSVRLNFWASAWEREAEGLTREVQVERLVEVVEAATDRGLRVLLTWHDFTDDPSGFVTGYDAVFPMMRAVLQQPEIADDPLVHLEPFNEPGGDIGWDAWRPGMLATMTYLRAELGYRRTLFVDTPGWSSRFSPAEADEVLAHDAELRGGAPNVAFANHRYPGANVTYEASGDRATHDAEVLRHVGSYPIVGTEHGWDLDHGHGPRPQWLAELLDHLVTDRIPAGHNGAFAWVWSWHPNGLTRGVDSAAEITTLSEHGRLWQQRYWDRLD